MANNDLFDAYFKKADLDGDGQISGAEAVAFSQGSNLPKHVLAQIWAHADQKKVGYLGRAEFYNFLKLVTVAQSKRELTPDMVKAALYGPASAKIPAPQINLVATPAPQSKTAGPVPQAGTSAPSQSSGVRGPPNIGNAGGNQQYFQSQSNQFSRPPQGMLPSAASQSQPAFASQGMPRGVTPGAPRPPSSTTSTDWLRGSTGGSLGVVNTQLPNKDNNSSTSQDPFVPAISGIASSFQPRPLMAAGQTPSVLPKTQDKLAPSNQLADKDSKESIASGNGFPSDSLFGDGFSAIPAQPKQNSLAAPASISSSSVSTGTVPPSTVPVTSVKPTPHESLPTTFGQHPVVGQHQKSQSTGKLSEQPATQSTTAPSPTGFSVGAGNLASSQSTQSQHPWPKMTPAEVHKYSKVFVQVDTDKDGKITGEQARNLFLSWRLPREILKQVWDLSDQDNDSMLSFREFCIALYLMERYREGRTLPTMLPSNIMPGETLGFGTAQPPAAYGNATWRPAYGFQQSNIPGASRPPLAVARGKPPRPVPASHGEGAMPAGHQKPKVPVLEKHIVDQLSKEEQDSLNAKFQEATAINKKVEELEKEITDSKQKIEFCRVKMQELIFYKSRCDNRLNEIMERVSADKHEVESLARKYEEKYKQTGDVASKLTIEEATFRDIQEKKMELYQAIVKMEEGNPENGVLKERAEGIESALEELIKTLNERCKQYGLRGKPTTLVELPYGWQPGIQEGAADWDEDWDKFDDEGFTFVKELTLDVQNVVAPPKQKCLPIENGPSSTNEVSNASCLDIDAKSEKVAIADEHSSEKELTSEQGDALKRSPPVSPAGGGAAENQPPEFQDSSHVKSNDADGSRHAEDNRSDHGGAESTVSADKIFDEPSWGTFDTHYDTDSVWGFDSDSGKDGDHRINDDLSGFGLSDFNIKPIKTGATNMDGMFPGMSQSVFADSVPSTPAYNFGNSPQRFSEGSELGIRPMTETPRTDNIFPGGPSLFADSVPSTPAYNFGSSPHRFSEDHSFDSFSRFDSFNMHESGFSQSPRHSLARFDSMRSTSDSDLFPSRFDSFNAQRFDSFNAQRFDSLSVHESGFSQSPRNSLSRFDSMRSTGDSEYSHGFSSFDETDPFGSSGPFKTSSDSQTRRRSSDNWSAF